MVFVNNKNYFKAFILVLTAGLIWSFGAVVVRHMIDGNIYVFQYLFLRGLATSIVVISYCFYREGMVFYKNLFQIDFNSIIGGFFLSVAFICFIFSIINTTAAVTLFMLAVIPFLAAIFGFFILKEILNKQTLISILLATIGICVMIFSDFRSGGTLGAFLGLLAATGFALYTITIRLKPNSPKFLTVILAGLICSFFSILMLDFSFDHLFNMPIINYYLSITHGLIIGSGFILYSLGAKFLPSADLTFLTLLEIVGGVFWVWFPIFGINEIPGQMVLLGGLIVLSSIIYYGYNLSYHNVIYKN